MIIPGNRIFAHAMLREIFEQPQAIVQTLAAYANGRHLVESAFAAAGQALAGHDRILISASGSSRHAGLVGKYLFESFAELDVVVQFGSESLPGPAQSLRNLCFLAISQSGETSDTSRALRDAIARGDSTIAITNEANSSMAQMALCSLPTMAGKELAVPATKSFTCQLVVLSLLAFFAANMRGLMTSEDMESHLSALNALPRVMADALPNWEDQMAAMARDYLCTESIFFLGRGPHYAIACEGALKLKESAYIHAEGYPAGELRHGPAALVDRDTLLIVLATRDAGSEDSNHRYAKTVNLLRDLQPQHPRIISIVSNGDERVSELSNRVIHIPEAPEHISMLYEAVPLQLFAYFMAAARNINMDTPRHLAKAVLHE